MTVLVLEAGTLNELYPRVLDAVLAGAAVQPRGLPTLERLHVHLVLRDPRQRLLTLEARAANPAFAVAEAVWVLSGSADPWIFTFNESLRAYVDQRHFHGVYGPRIRRWQGRIDQLDHVRRLLLRDPASRQAVVQVFDPVLDGADGRHVPCTLNYRFFLRSGALDMHTTMRSQDAWLGLPYDVFTATVLQELMAYWVRALPGRYVHSVDSLHLYEEHVPAARALCQDRGAAGEEALAASAPLAQLGVRWPEFDATLQDMKTFKPLAGAGWDSMRTVVRTAPGRTGGSSRRCGWRQPARIR